MKTYEGMFLVEAGIEFEQASQPVRALLDRAGAEVLSFKPWEERRLSYEIAGRRRGMYILTYFHAEPGQIVALERNSQLSDEVLRCLILRRDRITEEEINALTPATGGRPTYEERPEDEDRPYHRRDDRPRGRRDEGARSEEPEVRKDRPHREQATPDVDQPAEGESAHPSQPQQAPEKADLPEVRKEESRHEQATPDVDQPAEGESAHPSQDDQQ